MKLKFEHTQNSMNNARRDAILVFLGLALILCSSGYPAKAQKKTNNCKHPPKIVFQPRFSFSDEDQKKWKGKSVSGKIAIVISEEGDITQARVLAASPKEAVESLVNTVKQMKFEPRQGYKDVANLRRKSSLASISNREP